MLIVLLPVTDDRRDGGRLARQTALSTNSCCESVTGQEEAAVGGHKQAARTLDSGHDAGSHRAAPCQGLGQGARSTLGKGSSIVISLA